MRRRNVTGVILYPKSGDAGSVSPSVDKASGLYRESEIIYDKRLSRDRPDNSTEKYEEVREKLTISPAHRCARDTPTTTTVL